MAQDTGDKIIINIPILTEERRKELVRQATAEMENCKVSIRNARREGKEDIMKLNKDGLSDDACKIAEVNIQALTDKFISKADAILDLKEKDILTV